MFVVSEIQDLVEIRASSIDKESSILSKLKTKYAFKYVEGLGIAIHIKNLLEIKEFEIQSEILVADVTFEIIFYRFYDDEVSLGRIIRQEEEKIILDDALSNIYEVNSQDLFENCEYEAIEEHGKWIWNYKSNQLPFLNGETVRFKIKQVKENGLVEAAMNDPGLGVVKWWDK